MTIKSELEGIISAFGSPAFICPPEMGNLEGDEAASFWARDDDIEVNLKDDYGCSPAFILPLKNGKLEVTKLLFVGARDGHLK